VFRKCEQFQVGFQKILSLKYGMLRIVEKLKQYGFQNNKEHKELSFDLKIIDK